MHPRQKTMCLEMVVDGWFIDYPDLSRRVWVELSNTVLMFPRGKIDTL
jgi:hypothetical protein